MFSETKKLLGAFLPFNTQTTTKPSNFESTPLIAFSKKSLEASENMAYNVSNGSGYLVASSLDGKVEIRRADITNIQVDVVVNAANSALRGGSGVDGAIHRAAGSNLLKELIKTFPQGTPTGTAVITGAHDMLNCRWIIHGVGPRWTPTADQTVLDNQLGSVYETALELAVENGLKTIAFPTISTGIFNFPKPRAVEIVLGTVRDFLASDDGTKIDKVVLLMMPLNSEGPDEKEYLKRFNEFFPPQSKTSAGRPPKTAPKSSSAKTPKAITTKQNPPSKVPPETIRRGAGATRNRARGGRVATGRGRAVRLPEIEEDDDEPPVPLPHFRELPKPSQTETPARGRGRPKKAETTKPPKEDTPKPAKVAPKVAQSAPTPKKLPVKRKMAAPSSKESATKPPKEVPTAGKPPVNRKIIPAKSKVTKNSPSTSKPKPTQKSPPKTKVEAEKPATNRKRKATEDAEGAGRPAPAPPIPPELEIDMNNTAPIRGRNVAGRTLRARPTKKK